MAELWDPVRHWDGLTAPQKRRVGISAMAAAYAAACAAIGAEGVASEILNDVRDAAEAQIAVVLLKSYPRTFDHPAPPALAALGAPQCLACGRIGAAAQPRRAAEWCAACSRLATAA